MVGMSVADNLPGKMGMLTIIVSSGYRYKTLFEIQTIYTHVSV